MKFSVTRRKARERAVQMLYSWQVSHNDFLDIKEYFVVEYDMIGVDISYMYELCFGVIRYVHTIDVLMKPYLSRNFAQLGYVELVVLRIAIFELLKCFDIPYKVVINEAIELVKIFGSEKSYKFINGVLDRIAMNVRLSQ